MTVKGFLFSLMFVPCIIARSRNNRPYALIYTTPLFYILAPTCFGSSLPSSKNFLDPSELLEKQIEWVVYHIMCGYVACVPDCRGSVCCASHLSAYVVNEWCKSVHSVGYFYYGSCLFRCWLHSHRPVAKSTLIYRYKVTNRRDKICNSN
jgi:hypothetical protein